MANRKWNRRVLPHPSLLTLAAWLLVLSGGFLLDSPTAAAQPPSRATVVREVQARVVKIYGAGGMAGLEAYQSGCIVSPQGHIATVWSYVLDVDPIVVLDDGRRFEAEIVGFEPSLELAVLKIDADSLPYFPVGERSGAAGGSGDAGSGAVPGAQVLAVSNLFSIAAGNEPASVMHGYIASEANLEARRGTFRTAYSGPVYVLDLVANNPGAAGGALVGLDGNLLGMLGKELRDERTGVWLNYAIPAGTLRGVIGDIVAGRTPSVAESTAEPLPANQAHSASGLGIVMIPNVLEKTPPFIDAVEENSPAAAAGLQPDDLILLAAGQRIEGQSALNELLRTKDRRDPVSVTVQRGSQVVTVTLRPR
ncbi:S1C family serine protease [Candidatus Laterigemmans baculatus]|uniref:S1C family serine protease n=1 Tax=Candidatus Laterigemmans baculatus TaxID=2770505 RepID=UPI0013DC88B6|nr:S1C family serine protease [Candidatus Laterigemmans baculatus]